MDATLDALLEEIETHDERGDRTALQTLVAEGRSRFPDAIELREWEATLAIDDARYQDALTILDEILVHQPDDFAARRERASVLVDLGRFSDALDALTALPTVEVRALPRSERAGMAHERGLCLDRLDRFADADAAYRDATRLDPQHYFLPARHPRDAFETLVADALDEIPELFRPFLAQVIVTIQTWPEPLATDPFQLGLYVGVPRSERTSATEDHLDTIVVYQRSHELQCADDVALRSEVRKTVLHEIAHHFGLEDGEMGGCE